MFFSVIIPTYNRAALLRTALDSVFAQTFTDYEVIVVDDGSTDETAVMVASYGGRVRYFQQQNKGPGEARNLGIKNATGEYIAFLDSDDMWLPWALEVVQSSISCNKSPSMLVTKSQDFTDTVELSTVRRQPLRFRLFPDYITAAQRDNYTILTCSSVILQSAEIRRAGGFTNGNFNAEDLDLWLRLGDAPGFVEIECPVCCGYRRHASSAVTNLGKTHAGLIHMIKNELQGVYPGGSARAAERQNIITRHVRPASLSLAKCSKCSLALDLYWKTLRWHGMALRMKYIIGFWFVLLISLLTRPKHIR